VSACREFAIRAEAVSLDRVRGFIARGGNRDLDRLTGWRRTWMLKVTGELAAGPRYRVRRPDISPQRETVRSSSPATKDRVAPCGCAAVP